MTRFPAKSSVIISVLSNRSKNALSINTAIVRGNIVHMINDCCETCGYDLCLEPFVSEYTKSPRCVLERTVGDYSRSPGVVMKVFKRLIGYFIRLF